MVSGFAALDALRAQGVAPRRPLGIASFVDEEGARFGVACAGSRLITGALDADKARGLRDADGITMADALTQCGPRPGGRWAADDETLRRIASFVELHVEQGRGLVHTGDPVGVGRMIWPHGRWRVELRGEANHAGHHAAGRPSRPDARPRGVHRARARGPPTTPARWRPSASCASTRTASTRSRRRSRPGWTSARRTSRPSARSSRRSQEYAPTEESWTPVTVLDADLAGHGGRTRSAGHRRLSTGAGHDAGILAAAGIPTAMLFVRNPSGISHAPAEDADEADCLAGIDALTAVLERLLT